MKSQGGTEAMLFGLGAGLFGIPLTELSGMHRLEKWTVVPGAPDYLVGVFNQAGEIRPIYDLGRLLRLADTPARAEDPVILLRFPSGSLAIRVEEPLSVVSFSPHQLTQNVGAQDYVRGSVGKNHQDRGWQLIENLHRHPRFQHER